ncbi:flagellar hook assembly protein FlgD [Deferrisoma camini]|uniref:flagellar hook assembly protein FlgD n=1 Tax=Deferrisoma camini TaxID=1035120 RepID=UPI00046D0EFC|nr:flagellar hook capping FlgD N-terminal domain-containing protein [Deferrisoma camini]
MDISVVSGPAGVAPADIETGRNAQPIADFQDFLKLFVSQLKYQDPLSPTGSEEFLAETAQFSTVEQLVNLNRRAEAAVQGGEVLRRATAAAYLGRTVTASISGEGGDTVVTGRVTAIEFADDGAVLLGLDDGQEVPLADVVHVAGG